MPYNKQIDERIQKLIARWKDTEEKNMFGGVCHLLKGNMFCGVYKDFLILRLGEEGGVEALKSQYTRPFDITGKPMKGWVMVEEGGFKNDEDLGQWLKQAKDFVKTLHPKEK